MSEIQILDIEHFISYVGDDPIYQKEMANLFQSQSLSYLNALKEAYQASNNEEWHDVSHQIKGLAAFSGSLRLREQAMKSQDNATAPNGEKKEMLNDLERIITVTNDAFNDFLNR